MTRFFLAFLEICIWEISAFSENLTQKCLLTGIFHVVVFGVVDECQYFSISLLAIMLLLGLLPLMRSRVFRRYQYGLVMLDLLLFTGAIGIVVVVSVFLHVQIFQEVTWDCCYCI